jgi:hypothetical protein
MWNRSLAARARLYSSGVLSVVDADGYPFSARCQVIVDDAQELIAFTNLPAVAAEWRGAACLLFHRHDDRLENQYQLLIRGQLVAENGQLVFRTDRFVSGGGSPTSDRMPHAGAPLQLIQFLLLGRRQAASYLRRRKTAWPVDFTPMLRVLRELGG